MPKKNCWDCSHKTNCSDWQLCEFSYPEPCKEYQKGKPEPIKNSLIDYPHIAK